MDIRSREKNQSDLFEQVQAVDKKIRRKARFLLLDVKNSITVSYETALFFMIGFIMASIITFSLGVEKGRHDAKSQSKLELKKGVSNVAAPKPKNVKSR